MIKIRIQDIIDFLDKKRIKGLNKDVFQFNSIFYAMGYKIFKSSNSYTFKKNPTRKKTKDRKEVVTVDQIKKIEKFYRINIYKFVHL